MSSSTNKYLVGVFDDDHTLIHAVEHIRHDGIEITDAYTPFPVHGLEHAMALPPTRLHTAGFFFGLTGFTVALSMITFINKFNYPTNIGGKPLWAILAYVPITFEHTVLYASIGMTVSFYYLCKMWPGKIPKIFDDRFTDNLFGLTFDLTGKDADYVNKVTAALKGQGAIEVYQKEI